HTRGSGAGERHPRGSRERGRDDRSKARGRDDPAPDRFGMSDAVPVVPVHDYVRRAAGRRPDAVALVGERRLTYAELDARSNAFARALWRHSADRGDRIALWLPKSHAAVVAIYGALKAGCAYVPLDPAQPPGRAGSILGDAEPTVLVTDTAHLGQLASRG